MSKHEIKVALIGNPNVGKSSIFNLLTGMNQHVGNYPGVTVDKKVGFCKLSQTSMPEYTTYQAPIAPIPILWTRRWPSVVSWTKMI